MRRSEKEIKDLDEIVKIIQKCDVCRLALNDGEYPYILPLNFGVDVAGGKLTLYFHGASDGKKYDLITKNNKAGFEMDSSHRLIIGEMACGYGYEFESIVGCGTIHFVGGDEKRHALNVLMAQYSKDKMFEFDEASLSKTIVFKLSVLEVTGKRSPR